MEYNDGDIADDGAGNFVVYKYGRWHPADETGRPLGPIDASSRWGSGARELPNGSVERVGPRGGVSVIANTPQGDEGVGRLTEGQGKAMLYGGMMAGAERDYQRARENGYDPASIRNQIAGVAGVIPFDGDYFGRLIRDDVSDAGRQAELRWAEGNLRQLTGAAATNPEIARVAAINFDRGNDQLAGQRYQTRAETYEGTRYAAGPGAAQLDPYPVYGLGGAGPVDETGLPTYPAIEGGQEIAPIPTGASIRRGPDGKSYAVVNSENLAPEDTPESLRAAGYQQDADGTWFRMVGSDLPPGSGGGVNGSARPGSGGEAAPAPAGVLEARENDRGLGRRADTFVRGIADAATFGLSDEITAGLNTIAPLDRGTRGGWNGDWGGAYRQNLDLMRGIDEADAEQMPLTRGAGQLVGALGGGVSAARLAPQIMRQAPRVAGATVTADRLRRGANVARYAAGGAAGGGAYGAGSSEGGLAERGGNALEGAAIGGVLGPVAGAVGERVIAPAISGIGRMIRPNALEDAAATYANRFRPDTNALAARATELEGLGTQPAFIDLVDDARLGTFRAINTRDTPAREAGTRLAETRRRNLPSRVRQIADEEISNDTRPTLEVIEGLATARRNAASAGSADFANQTVNLDENVATALRSPLTRSTLGRAAEVMDASLDPAERQAAEYIRQLAAGDAGRGAMLSVREVQDITKALNTAARSAFSSDNPTAGPTLRSLSGAIRQAGRDQSDDYARFLDRYSDDMGLEEAATTGRNFVQAAPDPISERGTDAFVRNAANASPPELAVQRAAARQAMEAAGAGPTGARSVLEGLASNQDQGRRAAAIGADPARLQARADAELRMVQNAQNVSPRVGSQTGTNMADQAAEVAGTARDVMTGNLPGVVTRVGRRLMSRGFNDRQAEAIGLAALDPTRTREVIDLLATRMNRQEARSLLRAIRFSAAQQSGEYAGDEE